ncbi:MAG: response regulator [Verrucomicrobia bacterium]|nr:response regulator [Verrucomicrobiota bacterium]
MSSFPPKKTILSVDDSLTIRKLIENALKPAGYEVLLAANGEEGLRLAHEARPDLILLDYVLPDVRGVEFCQRLLAEETTRAVPVLLISGHGSAIQELYRDCANVVDYLTKPFAANVLQAVVANVLARPEKQTAPAATPAPAVVAEGKAPATLTAAATQSSAPPAPATGLAPDAAVELRQRIFEKLIDRLHAPLPSIPAWEAARGEQEPFSYYLSRLLPIDLVNELATELVAAGQRLAAATGKGSGAGHETSTGKPEPTLRGSTRFVSERHVLNFLCSDGAHGELRFALPEETVSVLFDHGAIVAISSNHPRFYCAGSAYPFLQVPHAVVSAAMLAQRDSGVPFFITVHAQGSQPAGVDLPELLRECGHRCLERLYVAPELTFSFTPLAELPAFAREHRVEYFLSQLLLESYRLVNDWQHIQEAVPRLELFVGRTAADAAYLGQLRLNALETALLAQIDSRRTVAQLQEALGQPIFEVCRALYCLARLDLCFLSDLPLSDEETPTAASVHDAVETLVTSESSPTEVEAVAAVA